VSDLKDKNWLELCEAASREQDPEKLLQLITALNEALEQKEREEKAQHMLSRLRQWPAAASITKIVAA
jgi:hypothetical protein